LLAKGPNPDASRELEALMAEQIKKDIEAADKENEEPRQEAEQVPKVLNGEPEKKKRANHAGSLDFEEVAKLAVTNAQTAKDRGNKLIKSEHYVEAACLYEVGLDTLHAAVEIGKTECDPEAVKKSGESPQVSAKKLYIFEEALELQQALRSNLSLARFKAGNYEASVVAASAVLERSPLEPKVLFRRGLALLKLGKVDEARKDLEAMPAEELTPAVLRQLAEAGYDKPLRDFADRAREQATSTTKKENTSPEADAAAAEVDAQKDDEGTVKPAAKEGTEEREDDAQNQDGKDKEEEEGGGNEAKASIQRRGRVCGLPEEGLPVESGNTSEASSSSSSSSADDTEELSEEHALRNALSEARDAKAKGNSQLQDGSFEAALKSYSIGLRTVADAKTAAEGKAHLQNLRSDAEQMELVLQLNLSLCMLKFGDAEGSALAATEALKLHPRHTKALFRRAQAHTAWALQLEESAEEPSKPRQLRNLALADLKEVMAAEPGNAEARRAMALLRESLRPSSDEKEPKGTPAKEDNPFAGIFGDAKQMRERQRNAKEKKRQEELTRLRGMGNDAHRAGDYDAARTHYTSAMELDPTNVGLLLNRAAANLMLQCFEDGFEDCRHATETDPTCGKAYVRGAKCLQGNGAFDDAEAFLKKGFGNVSKEEQYDLSAQMNAIRTASQVLGQISQVLSPTLEGSISEARWALKKLDEAEALGHSAPKLRSMRLQALLQSRDLTHAREAEQLSRSLLQDDPDSPQLSYWHSLSLLWSGKRPDAKSALQQAKVKAEEAESPLLSAVAACIERLSKAEELKDEGNKLFQQRRWEEAAEKYEEGLAPCVGDLEMLGILHTNIAAALRKVENRSSDALKHANKATAANPRYAKAFFRRGVLLYDEGRWRESLEDFRKTQDLEARLQGLDDWLLRARHALSEGKERRNHYKVLGLQCDCRPEDIKKRYRVLAKECHPDKVRSASEQEKAASELRFKAANEAHEVLSNEEKRKEYDFGPPEARHGGSRHGGYGFGGGNGFGGFNFHSGFHRGRGSRFHGGFDESDDDWSGYF